jgi:nucleotide-binding universal stress UspA family protein
MIKDLVVKLEQNASRDPSRDFAISMAQSFDAHVAGMAFDYEYFLPGYVAAELPRDLLATVRAQHEKAVRAAIDRFDELAMANQLSAEHRLEKARESDVPDLFATLARRFDLSVVMQSEPQGVDNNDIIEAALFDSGKPVCIVPFIQRNGLALDRLVCCWDGSRTAARAFDDALPFLVKAGAVNLLIVLNEKTKNDEGEIRGIDMGKHLARHGVKVEVKTTVAADIDVADAILSYVADSVATMIVMGGYGHSRLREIVLGGVTREILSSMTVPVLMSH